MFLGNKESQVFRRVCRTSGDSLVSPLPFTLQNTFRAPLIVQVTVTLQRRIRDTSWGRLTGGTSETTDFIINFSYKGAQWVGRGDRAASTLVCMGLQQSGAKCGGFGSLAHWNMVREGEKLWSWNRRRYFLATQQRQENLLWAAPCM